MQTLQDTKISIVGGAVLKTTTDQISGMIVSVERTQLMECDDTKCVAIREKYFRILHTNSTCYATDRRSPSFGSHVYDQGWELGNCFE
jgi:hypothetical protein